MNISINALGAYKVEKRWVKEEDRIFTEYPGVPGVGFVGGLETWLELAKFYVEDLKWLLSLDHHKFWSHMIYSEKAHELLVNFLKEYPPNHVKKNFFIQEDMRSILKEIEHLVFLLFLRLSTEKESEMCYIKNFGEMIYSNHLFTVPIILDICIIYGSSNGGLIRKMINDVVTLAPYFLDDFQEIIPHFFHVLKVVKDKISLQELPGLKSESDVMASKADVVLYLSDSVATIERFIEVYPNICSFFSTGELITELVYFYSNILPQIESHCSSDNPWSYDLIGNIRIDMLKIVKNIFDFVSTEANEILGRTEMVNEYLTLMSELLSEPIFFYDYNLLYSVEFEIESTVRNCQDVDTVKLKHVLSEVASLLSFDVTINKENVGTSESDEELKLLIMKVKGIFPHMGENLIEKCLKYYDKDVERVIVAVLENAVPFDVTCDDDRKVNVDDIVEFRGNYKSREVNLNEVLDNREEKSAIKGRCMELSFDVHDMYDDEYDDTYDESTEFSVKEGDEEDRRAFVVPRVLRRLKEGDEEDVDQVVNEKDEEEEEEEEEVEEKEEKNGKYNFVEDPAVLRQRLEQKKVERGRRDLRGRGRGQGQSKEVIQNRGFKESHKSAMGNHNRKKQASRKLSKGMF